jgi:hypothetical protein
LTFWLGWCALYKGKLVHLKGTVSRDFCFRIFSWIIFPQAHENNVKVISTPYLKSSCMARPKVSKFTKSSRAPFDKSPRLKSDSCTKSKFKVDQRHGFWRVLLDKKSQNSPSHRELSLMSHQYQAM